MENKRSFNGRIVIGSILILIGATYLFTTFGILSYHVSELLISWPALLMFIGILSMVNHQNKLFGFIVLAIGSLFMLKRIFPEIEVNGSIIAPTVFILIGLLLIFRRRSPKVEPFTFRQEQVNDTDRIDDVSIFGGGTKVIHSTNFRGGNITAIFGGSEIDLTECKLAPGENVLDIVAIFGGVELKIPEDWKVYIDVLPIFGGFSHRTKRDPNLVLDPGSTLRVKGVVIMGGGEIKFKQSL